MLEVIGLAKRFGDVTAVADVSFSVGDGEAVGLLGPNGAGKTTTVSMICGLIAPDAGQILIDGRPLRGDADPAKRLLGLVPQELALVEELSARANLRFFGALQGLGGKSLRDAVARCLDLVDLAGRADHAVRTFSGGMKRRLNLAAALLHDPQLIVLDEPTVGVDPQSRNAIFEGLEILKARGRSLLYTTHYLEEAERLCDRLVIVDHGTVVADGDLASLAGPVSSSSRLVLGVEAPGDGAWLGRLRSTPGVLSAEHLDDRLIVGLESLGAASKVLGGLDEAGVVVTRIATERVDLQSIFLDLTGRSVRDS
ncbi:ABC transporter ATP-binding protein [Tundrisphaera lichenicola]|uniref:ABC transporter ATP-binding protein n=1 Tax=Tundrisphaera lichenicola TaxID=2029860 RepID=UPI003EBCD6D2